MDKREYIFQYVPKLGVEMITVCGLVGMCSYLLWKGKPHHEITYMLGLMATAGFRLIPSFSRILNNVQSLGYGWASVDTLVKEFPKSSQSNLQAGIDPAATNQVLKFENELTFSNITFSFEDEHVLLDGIEFSLKKGSTTGLTGVSGSGKSTLTDLLLGLIKPDSGEILIDNESLEEKNLTLWLSMIGYVPQDVYILDDTVRNNIAFGVCDEEIDDDRIWSILKIVNLDSFIKKNTDGLDTLLGERGSRLSGGQKQRLGVARALFHDPEILILDEFTNALDRETEQEVLKMFRPLKGKKTILIIAHSDFPLTLCDQIYCLENNKIKVLEKDSSSEDAGKYKY